MTVIGDDIETLFQAVKHGKMVIGDLLNVTLSLYGSLESFPIASRFVTLSPGVPSPRAVRLGKEPCMGIAGGAERALPPHDRTQKLVRTT